MTMTNLDSVSNPTVRALIDRYVARLDLGGYPLRVTDDRPLFQRWLGRRVDAQIGGAYVYLARLQTHLVLINAPRIDASRPKSLEIVVAEELLHMRDWIDGDRRRHAKHGHDRIAHRVAALTESTLDDVQTCLLPAIRRPFKYEYACPKCGTVILRRLQGTWSCRRCSPRFDRSCVFRLARVL